MLLQNILVNKILIQSATGTSIMELQRCKKLLVSRFFVFCAVLGFIIQVVQVSMRFFAYTTTTTIALHIPPYIEPHPVALCMRFTDIIDRDKMLKETGVKLEILHSLEDGIREEGKLTIEQIFDYTPGPDHVISKCTIRPSGWLMTSHGAEYCAQVFVVRKFFTQEFICYHISERNYTPMHIEAATRSTFSKGNIYTLFFNESFNNLDSMTPITFRGKMPGRSRDHAPLLAYLRDRSKKKSAKKFAFLYLTPADVNRRLLERPYDTKCVVVHAEAAGECRLDCLIEGFAPYDKVPGYELLTQKYKRRTMRIEDVQHPTNGPIIKQIHEDCDRKCRFKSCDGGFTVTHTRQREANSSGIGFSLTAPIDPRVDLTAQPTMFFVEFFSFLCSCFGTWFGISFLSINSIKLLRLTKEGIGW